MYRKCDITGWRKAYGNKKSFLMAVMLSFAKENAPRATVHNRLFARATSTTGIYNYLAGNGLIK